MKDPEKKGRKEELTELLERETLFLEIVRKLQGLAFKVFARPESLDKLTEEMKACEAQIVKRYFFPVDKTIDAFTDKPAIAREELIKKSEEDGGKLLLFIDILDKEVMNKELEITELKSETKKLREMLTNL
jgi:vacuolar-type H+-ATPase subunit I/STV1